MDQLQIQPGPVFNIAYGNSSSKVILNYLPHSQCQKPDLVSGPGISLLPVKAEASKAAKQLWQVQLEQNPHLLPVHHCLKWILKVPMAQARAKLDGNL